MSVQFGKCNFDGKPVDPKELDEVRPVLAPYGPDGEGSICKDTVGIFFRAFHTTKESRRERQPYVSKSGFVLTWDGRLDNREELIGRLKRGLLEESTDLEIVAAAYESWNTSAFATLVGDWALSIWDTRDRSIILAKDFVGTRHLYYSFEKDQVAWCTILDPLVLFAGHPWQLEEEYIAGWLAFFPATQLTPYVGIHAVPPSCFVRLAKGAERVTKYWDFDPAKRIDYRTDGEYEEHFRQVFRESVRRRLRSDSPILAELSGGMDSSSIVCMADCVIAAGKAATPRLDTVSYYDDSEPNWNERPYFMIVEEQRDRVGWHIDVQFKDEARELQGPKINTSWIPFMEPAKSPAFQFRECLCTNANRVLLSGVGGDEFLGGVPTPIPELTDLAARCRLRDLIRRSMIWALKKRVPWFHLAAESITEFLPQWMQPSKRELRNWKWFCLEFTGRHRTALSGYQNRLKFLGPLPSFQEDLATLQAVQRQLGCLPQSPEPMFEIRYPLLDRNLLEFLFATPPEQLVRPGQRRSLMRRALRRIVPQPVLDRRRKAFAVRYPIKDMQRRWCELMRDDEELALARLGVLRKDRLAQAIQRASLDNSNFLASLSRTLALEEWIRPLSKTRTVIPPGELFHPKHFFEQARSLAS